MTNRANRNYRWGLARLCNSFYRPLRPFGAPPLIRGGIVVDSRLIVIIPPHNYSPPELGGVVA